MAVYVTGRTVVDPSGAWPGRTPFPPPQVRHAVDIAADGYILDDARLVWEPACGRGRVVLDVDPLDWRSWSTRWPAHRSTDRPCTRCCDALRAVGPG